MNTHFNKNGNRSCLKLTGYATLRFFQFASAVLVMSLIAYAIHAYDFHGSKKTNFVLSVGVIGLFYNIALFFLAIAVPKLVYAGVYIFWEVVMCLLWFCAFIVDAKVQGDHSCKIKHTDVYKPKYGSEEAYNESAGEYNPFTHKYTTKAEKTACQSAKASIAFAGLSWALFLISSVFIGVNIMKPIMAQYGTAGLWKSGSSMGTRLDRASALTLVDPVEGAFAQDDVEAAQAPAADDAADQHTASDNDNASYGDDKSEASAEPAQA